MKKFLTITLTIIFLGGLGYYIWRAENYRLKYIESLEKEVTVLNDSLESKEIQISEILEDYKTKTVKAKSTSNNIDKNLKKNEKAIDNRNVTNSELRDFLAKYD